MHPLEQNHRVIALLEEILEVLTIQNKHRFMDQYLVGDEVAELLRVTPRTIRNWKEEGVLPYASVGRRTYFRLSDLEKLFEEEFSRPKKRKVRSSARKKIRRRKLRNGSWVIRSR